MATSSETPFRAWHLPSFPPEAQGKGPDPGDRFPARLQGRGASPLEYLPLTSGDLERVMTGLREAHGKGLRARPVGEVVEGVDRVARRLMDPGDELRQEALRHLGPQAGFSGPMAETVLDGMARDWTRDRLLALLEAEFSDPGVLDGFRDRSGGGQTRASGYPLTLHIGAGTVPGVATTSLIRALLVKSAVLLKPGRGDVVLPVVFARGLAEEAPSLSRTVAVVYWPGHSPERTEGDDPALTALRGADLVVAYGSDETLREIRDALPLATPFRAYRHRMGVGMVGKEALGAGKGGTGPGGGRKVARKVAREGAVAVAVAREVAMAAALFDQRGCVSPQVVLVEEGGETKPETFAELLARELEILEEELPSGRGTDEEAAALHQLRGEGEINEAVGRGRVLHGGKTAPWTVLYQPGGELQPTCLNRSVRVIPVGSWQDAVERLRPWRPHLQTVGLAGWEGQERRVMDALAALGVSRVTSFSRVPWPPAWWHHDGTGPLRTLVRWMDREGAGPAPR